MTYAISKVEHFLQDLGVKPEELNSLNKASRFSTLLTLKSTNPQSGYSTSPEALKTSKIISWTNPRTRASTSPNKSDNATAKTSTTQPS